MKIRQYFIQVVEHLAEVHQEIKNFEEQIAVIKDKKIGIEK